MSRAVERCPDCVSPCALRNVVLVMPIARAVRFMRVAKASVELATAPQFDKVIKNYDLDKALKESYDLVADFVGVSSEEG